MSFIFGWQARSGGERPCSHSRAGVCGSTACSNPHCVLAFITLKQETAAVVGKKTKKNMVKHMRAVFLPSPDAAAAPSPEPADGQGSATVKSDTPAANDSASPPKSPLASEKPFDPEYAHLHLRPMRGMLWNAEGKCCIFVLPTQLLWDSPHTPSNRSTTEDKLAKHICLWHQRQLRRWKRDHATPSDANAGGGSGESSSARVTAPGKRQRGGGKASGKSVLEEMDLLSWVPLRELLESISRRPDAESNTAEAAGSGRKDSASQAGEGSGVAGSAPTAPPCPAGYMDIIDWRDAEMDLDNPSNDDLVAVPATRRRVVVGDWAKCVLHGISLSVFLTKLAEVESNAADS